MVLKVMLCLIINTAPERRKTSNKNFCKQPLVLFLEHGMPNMTHVLVLASNIVTSKVLWQNFCIFLNARHTLTHIWSVNSNLDKLFVTVNDSKHYIHSLSRSLITILCFKFTSKCALKRFILINSSKQHLYAIAIIIPNNASNIQ